jgi:MerR family transcriptional regulator, light-induced transcriptional regulator
VTEKEAVRTASRRSRLYLDALRAGDGSGAYRVAERALDEGIGLPSLYQRVVTPAMHAIGTLWETGALTVADEHMATALTNRVLAAMRPPPTVTVEAPRDDAPPPARAILAAVEGERHALGLRMASDILEDNGLRVTYLGADVPTDALLQAVDSLAPDLLVLAATMSTLAPRLEEVASSVRQAHPGVELLLGGQAAFREVAGAALIQDFEALPGWVSRLQGRGG